MRIDAFTFGETRCEIHTRPNMAGGGGYFSVAFVDAEVLRPIHKAGDSYAFELYSASEEDALNGMADSLERRFGPMRAAHAIIEGEGRLAMRMLGEPFELPAA